jgi:N utilization substance protein A
MATRKKTKKSKNNSRKKVAPRKNSKRAVSSGSRKVSSKAKTVNSKKAKAKMKKRTSSTKATKNTKPRSAAAGRTTPRNNTRIIRSSLASRGEGQSVETINLQPKGLDPKSGGQSGALQGLSDVESASSESVDELLEEGNAFEAEVVKGVEDAPDADQGEVRTHQRPQEEDLPEDFREN